jgi:hypothetical protein
MVRILEFFGMLVVCVDASSRVLRHHDACDQAVAAASCTCRLWSKVGGSLSNRTRSSLNPEKGIPHRTNQTHRDSAAMRRITLSLGLLTSQKHPYNMPRSGLTITHTILNVIRSVTVERLPGSCEISATRQNSLALGASVQSNSSLI